MIEKFKGSPGNVWCQRLESLAGFVARHPLGLNELLVIVELRLGVLGDRHLEVAHAIAGRKVDVSEVSQDMRFFEKQFL